MLKVKKKISKKAVNKNQEDHITRTQNELKNFIKNLYINDQKKKRKQQTNMRNLLQKLEKNMQNYNEKIIN